LDAHGFAGCYDFIYVPHDFRTLPRLVNRGYFIINFISHKEGLRAMSVLGGFQAWTVDSDKVMEGAWATETQGLDASISRYNSSPVMHERVPNECKPLVLENGRMVDLAPTKKKIKLPRGSAFKNRTGDDGDNQQDQDDSSPDESTTNAKAKLVACSACGHKLNDDENFCSKCGAKRPQEKVTCHSCQRTLKKGENFCAGCGTKRPDKDGQEGAASASGAVPMPGFQIREKNTFIDVQADTSFQDPTFSKTMPF